MLIFFFTLVRLVLLREVPILQTASERKEYEAKNAGSHDILFCYQKAIGTAGM